MKILKYLTYSLVLSLILVSCDKHELKYINEKLDESTMAEFQLHYFEPITATAANYIDSVFINDVLYSSVDGSGQLATYNGVPGGSVGRFFTAKAGDMNIKFYRDDEIIYNQNCTLNLGKQNVIVHDLNKAPIVIDNQYPYWKGQGEGAVAETFTTDSVTSIMFVNLLYEKDAEGNAVPYNGKLQYQYKDVRTEEWVNIGDYVAFGEATPRTKVKVVKTIHNSSGYCTIYYRSLDESGNVLKICNSRGNMVDYSDYWTGYVGYVRMHFFAGFRNDKSIRASVRQWTSL